MNFKFFRNNIPDEPAGVTLRDYPVITGRFPEEYIDRSIERERNIERMTALANARRAEMLIQQPLSTNNRPAVFLNLNRRRDDISDIEWEYMMMAQRRRLIDHMFEQGMIMHTITSQDENGFSLRTEILF